jgi:hypothetical protein
MRIVSVIAVVVCGWLVGSCGSTGSFIGDNLPPWAGGLPAGTPPRPGTPGYDAYWKSVSGSEAGQPPAAPARAAPPVIRKSREPVDDPIH